MAGGDISAFFLGFRVASEPGQFDRKITRKCRSTGSEFNRITDTCMLSLTISVSQFFFAGPKLVAKRLQPAIDSVARHSPQLATFAPHPHPEFTEVTTLAKPKLTANANAQPRRNHMCIACDESFPQLADERSIFVVHEPLQTIEIISSAGSFRPTLVSLPNLECGLLERLRTEAVISWLVTTLFDALDIADLLAEAGYEGRYIALAQNAPDRQLICREVCGRAPNVKFDVCRVTFSERLS